MTLNYNILTSILNDYPEEDSAEFQARIPTFIEVAEDRLFRDLDTYGFVQHETTSVSVGDPFITKPTNTAIIKAVAYVSNNRFTVLAPRTNEFIQIYWPERTSVGKPKFYCNWDNETFIVAPTPYKNATLEGVFVVRPSVLSTTNTTNWYTTFAERALIAAVMVEASMFMKSYEAATTWDKIYVEEVMKLRNEARRQRRDDTVDNVRPGGSGDNLTDGAN